MADPKKCKPIVRELKWLDAKEPDPSSLNIRGQRVRNVNEEIHTPSIRHLPPGPICVHSTVQYSEKSVYHIPMIQCTPPSVSTILPQSSWDLDTDQDEIIDKKFKNVAQTFNQMLLMTTTGNPTSNPRLEQNPTWQYFGQIISPNSKQKWHLKANNYITKRHLQIRLIWAHPYELNCKFKKKTQILRIYVLYHITPPYVI